ncbi:hypothetical protein [Halorubrum lipolyticum]|uniref:Uncharacterized protein n=1 Tax=Halorubrum lipolyticum DSM 21995 TaxID=1227482 RepID=M0NNW2_9EURY|nr:hypothetical protein [Halorubrum lipolyticum]EMA59622.1 hypothetical protein C469_09871 [Halorubrum lipolyticum DSM 21995]
MRSSLAWLTEIRRALPLAAAVLLVGALLVPMWRITLTAPQYPGQELLIELYAYPRLGGDFAEVQGLNKYAGFYYPDPVYVDPNYEISEAAIDVPEWLLGPVVFAGLALTGAFVAFAPTVRKLKTGLTAQFVGTIAVFVGMFAFIQYRLHQAGHSLDPDAPLRGIDSFTPPLLGPYEVANISGFAWFGPGGYMTLVAVALLAVAYLARDVDATVGELPELARALPGAVRERTSNGGRRSNRGDQAATDESERDRDADRNPEIGGGDRVG